MKYSFIYILFKLSMTLLSTLIIIEACAKWKFVKIKKKKKKKEA